MSEREIYLTAICRNKNDCHDFCVIDGQICENLVLKPVLDEMFELKRRGKNDLIQKAFRRISSTE